MFVRYFVEVPLTPSQAEQALLEGEAGWLQAMADQALARGDVLAGQVGVGPGGPRLGRRVTLRLGDPVRFPSTVSLPLVWEPVGLQGLLPRLEGTIELGSLGTGRTQLAISARYTPPLGVLGRAVDQVLLHRVAEATCKDFLDRLGAAITLSQPGGAATMGS